MSSTVTLTAPTGASSPVHVPGGGTYNINAGTIEADYADFADLIGLGYLPVDPLVHALVVLISSAASGGPDPSTVNPLAPGTVSIGTSLDYARADHRHALQTTVAALTTGRTFSLTGGATGTSAAFTGAANASIPVTLATPTGAVRGGVLQQTAIPDLVDPPQASDINAVLTALRAAGVLAV